MNDPTKRFSNRVENYVKYRPGYPREVVDVLARECGLTPGSTVVDVGSGTGILTRLFLDNGNRVIAVEPNREMREAAERLLGGLPGFESVDGAAEATTLPDAVADLVAAGQAFHWFDQARTRDEFARILRPGGYVALVWNVRDVEANDFMRAYEALLREFGTDYEEVSHHGVALSEMDAFFGEGRYELRTLRNGQVLDYEGLRGRLLSSSYVPAPGQPGFEPMLAALGELFKRHAADGTVELVYATKVFLGRIGA